MTPLIDVLLVLIVMFILLVPATMHELPVDLPRWGDEGGAERHASPHGCARRRCGAGRGGAERRRAGRAAGGAW
jgi:hypothetical protein